MHKQKAPIYKLSRNKAPKHSKFRATDIREKPVNFFMAPHSANISSRSDIANFGSFDEVSIPA